MVTIKRIYYPHLLCHCDGCHGGGHVLGVGVGHGHGGGHCHGGGHGVGVGHVGTSHGDPNNNPYAHGPVQAYKINQKSTMTIALNEISNYLRLFEMEFELSYFVQKSLGS